MVLSCCGTTTNWDLNWASTQPRCRAVSNLQAARVNTFSHSVILDSMTRHTRFEIVHTMLTREPPNYATSSVANMILQWSDMLDFLSCGQFYFQNSNIFLTNSKIASSFKCFIVLCSQWFKKLLVQVVRAINCNFRLASPRLINSITYHVPRNDLVYLVSALDAPTIHCCFQRFFLMSV